MENVINNEPQKFMKRLYGPKAFFQQLSKMLTNMSDMRAARKANRVSKEFIERIMMAVTEVNGCRYCSYFHTQVALKAGMESGEIKEILSGDFETEIVSISGNIPVLKPCAEPFIEFIGYRFLGVTFGNNVSQLFFIICQFKKVMLTFSANRRGCAN